MKNLKSLLILTMILQILCFSWGVYDLFIGKWVFGLIITLTNVILFPINWHNYRKDAELKQREARYEKQRERLLNASYSIEDDAFKQLHEDH